MKLSNQETPSIETQKDSNPHLFLFIILKIRLYINIFKKCHMFDGFMENDIILFIYLFIILFIYLFIYLFVYFFFFRIGRRRNVRGGDLGWIL